jgi:hypothetical protein
MSKLMLKMIVIVFGVTFGGCSFGAQKIDYVNELRSYVDNTRVISMYYSTGLDAYYSSIAEMKEESMYVIKIRCFLGCDRYTKIIINHFSKAKKMASCPKAKDKYLLINFGDNRNIEYLKWGNIILFNGNCFYNKQSINDLLPGPSVFEKIIDQNNNRNHQ